MRSKGIFKHELIYNDRHYNGNERSKRMDGKWEIACLSRQQEHIAVRWKSHNQYSDLLNVVPLRIWTAIGRCCLLQATTDESGEISLYDMRRTCDASYSWSATITAVVSTYLFSMNCRSDCRRGQARWLEMMICSKLLKRPFQFQLQSNTFIIDTQEGTNRIDE